MMLSAVDDGQEIARAFKAGANDYLTKPFDPQEMLARLTRLRLRVVLVFDICAIRLL